MLYFASPRHDYKGQEKNIVEFGSGLTLIREEVGHL